MVITQRKKQDVDHEGGILSPSSNSTTLKRRNEYRILIRIALALLLPSIFYIGHIRTQTRVSEIIIEGKDHAVIIDFDTTRNKDIVKAEDQMIEQSYTLGPHNVTVSSTKPGCKNARIWMRIIGDALVDVPLTKDLSNSWVGSFTLPIEGDFQLESHWLGCNNEGKEEVKMYPFKTSGKHGRTEGMFAMSAWISADKVKVAKSDIEMKKSTYLWADVDKILEGKEMTPLEGPNKAMILKESVATDKDEFYSFGQLSNYELVCWIGSKSAEDIWGAFRAIRPQIFGSQRPFKFHYYPATSFITPDPAWKERTSFRKCKHILVSLDEPDDTLSQQEYKNQMTTFIKHLLNAFNEKHTFPALIWILTNNGSPMSTKSCHTPQLFQRTTHPCNDALEVMFEEANFPDRVRLLDNTIISSPILGGNGNRDQMLAAIALRIYVLVGKQVKAWRQDGQIGTIDGLKKNDVITPNYDLVPYDWSMQLE